MLGSCKDKMKKKKKSVVYSDRIASFKLSMTQLIEGEKAIGVEDVSLL